MTRFAVVGSGAWGTALACHLARLEHAVTAWAYEPEVAEEIATRHTNSVYLPDVSLPETIRASADAREVAASGDVVVLVPPSSHLRAVSTLAAPGVRGDALVVVATKGIEERTLKLMSMVLEETMPDLGPERLAFLCGSPRAPTRRPTSRASARWPKGSRPRRRRMTWRERWASTCPSPNRCTTCCTAGGRSSRPCASCSSAGTRRSCTAFGARDLRRRDGCGEDASRRSGCPGIDERL